MTHVRTIITVLAMMVLTTGMMACNSSGGESPVTGPADTTFRDTACPPVACDTLFDVYYEITLKRNGYTLWSYPMCGKILIEDENCDMDGSDVLVHFKFLGPYGVTDYPIPGIKNIVADGKKYTGQQSESVNENPLHSYDKLDEFELLVFQDGGITKIEGEYHQHFTHYHSRLWGPPTITETDWYCEVTGMAM